MSLLHRAVVALFAAVLGFGLIGLPSAATASPGRAAVSQKCENARAAAAKARHVTQHATTKLHHDQRRLKAAKKHHRPAKVKKLRKQVARDKAHLHTAKVKQKRANAMRRHNCASTSTGSTGSTGSTASDPTRAMGSVLGALAAGTNGGSLPTLDPTQVASLLDSLIPGASTGLDATQLNSLYQGFVSAPGLSASQLTDLLGSNSGLDPAAITDLANGGSLDPSTVTEAVTALSSLLGTATGGATTGSTGTTSTTPLPLPTDPTVITGTLTSTLGGLTGTTCTLLLGLC